MIDSLSFEKKNFISFSEFVIAISDKNDFILRENVMKFLFEYLDCDNSKVITYLNFKEALKRSGFSFEED